MSHEILTFKHDSHGNGGYWDWHDIIAPNAGTVARVLDDDYVCLFAAAPALLAACEAIAEAHQNVRLGNLCDHDFISAVEDANVPAAIAQAKENVT